MRPNVPRAAMHCVFLLGLFYSMPNALAQATTSIIPRPQQMTVGTGHFLLDAHTLITAPASRRTMEIAEFLHQEVLRQNGIDLPAGAARKDHRIMLRIDPSIAGNEAYRLQVTSQGVTISASKDRGLFWGVQTLRQLMPLEKKSHIEIPVVDIKDAPAFGYRGSMLDVSRHFYPVGFIKKQLDLLSYYKINTFHWHLTDDQGWRIQIRKYPKLTGIGAWRTEADGSRYGGFYTQQQIRDVVEYARERNIMIIPEIEMPGHSMAALAAYPELSCTKKPLQVANTWGVHKDIFCVGDEGTFVFLQNVLDEVIALFPAPYVHIGGDEVPKDRWKSCESCQQLMRAQNLKDEEGLQSYFIKRVQRYLAGKGKILIGWDEILEGGADRTAVVEIWRGDAEARKALANGNRVIIASPYYLDTPTTKLGTAEIYRLDPQTGLSADPEKILGAEAPLWSENADPLNAEARLYPRLQGLAESLWSAGARNDPDYADFQRRLQAQYPKLDAMGIGYGADEADVANYVVTLNAKRDGWLLSAHRGFPDLRSHYTINARDPDNRSPGFLDNVDIRQPGVLKVTPFRHGRAYDHPRGFTLIDQLALGKPVSLAYPPKPPYSGFARQALLDGVLGGDDPKDGTWVGWQDSDMDASIDLGKPTAIHSINVRFMQQSDSWILLPKQVNFLASTDGQHWTTLHAEAIRVNPDDLSDAVRTVHFADTKATIARYVRVEATRYGSLPAQHPGAGHQAWIFTDEILVR